jgi:hypothetical protein
VPKTTYLIMGQDLASTRQTRQHSPSTFARTHQTRRHSPSHVARTRQTRRHSPTAIFEKNVTRLDTFARVIRHFREFGASSHCLDITYNVSKDHFVKSQKTFNEVIKLDLRPPLTTFPNKTKAFFVVLYFFSFSTFVHKNYRPF